MTQDNKIINEEHQEKDLDVFVCSCKFYAPEAAQVSVAATDEAHAIEQVQEMLKEHKDMEIVSVFNTSRINLPFQAGGDDEDQLELPLPDEDNNSKKVH